MDDDLLADDGQYKDEELDDLDVTEEAALLGLSDEELDSRDNEELEYVDEDGNPVEIGENNAGLYEVANVNSRKRSTSPADEDVLELDLDAEIESFTQENPDLVRESPVNSYERQNKENLISLTSRNEREKSRRKESPDQPSSKMDSYSSQSSFNRPSTSEPYREPSYEDESDNESIDDHRERFKSERSNIITLTPANKRDIPDTLESVISVEENAKVQAFLEQEQQRKMRHKGGRGRNRNANFGRHQSYQHQSSHHHHHQNQPPHHHPNQNQPPHHQQHQNQPPHHHPNQQPQPHQGPPHQQQVQHQEPQFTSAAPPPQTYQSPPSSSPGRKILINPHFRGEVRLPIPATEAGMVVNQPPYDSKPPVAPYQQNPPYNPPPPVYSQDNGMNMAPMVFNAPPPTMQYGQPEYHPSGPPPPNVSQPNAWQPQELGPPPASYSNPPPVIMNYGDPIAQPPPNFHGNFNPAYQPQVPYQNLNVLPPQPMFNHQQPPVQLPPMNAFTPQAPISGGMILSPPVGAPEHHYPPPNQPPPNIQPNFHGYTSAVCLSGRLEFLGFLVSKPYHEQRNSNHNMPPPNQRNANIQNQRFPRPSLEKRPSSSGGKHIPAKMPRMENKKNTHVNNSNIREIPLVDTSAAKSNLTAKVTPSKPRGEVENWDEYLKEELEKQRLRREEIFRAKEERRKQNAIRLQEEIRKREMEKNSSNNIPVQRVVQTPKGRRVQQAGPKGNVRERIGIPMAKTVGPPKKKVVVVRKKIQSEDGPENNNQAKLPVRQRVGLKPGQNPGVQVQKKIIRTNTTPTMAAPTAPANQPVPSPVKPKAAVPGNVTQSTVTPAVKKTVAPAAAKANRMSPKQNKMQQRLGRRPGNDFVRHSNGPPLSPHGMPPRFGSPHPFMPEPPMRFPHPDMRMGPRPMFNEHRPPLLCDRPPPFMMEGNRFRMPGFPRGFPRDVPPFPPNHMRPGIRFEHNRPPFPRPPRFQKRNDRSRNSSGSSQRTSTSSSGPGSNASTPPMKNVKGNGNQGPNNPNGKGASESFSVSVEHISSSTNENSLKSMASTVGQVKNIQVETDKKRAVITFAESSQAEAFQKKFQRYMLDLSMIQVSLIAT